MIYPITKQFRIGGVTITYSEGDPTKPKICNIERVYHRDGAWHRTSNWTLHDMLILRGLLDLAIPLLYEEHQKSSNAQASLPNTPIKADAWMEKY